MTCHTLVAWGVMTTCDRAPDWYQTSTGRKHLCTVLEYYYSSVIQTQSLCFFAIFSNRHSSKWTSKHVSLILCKHGKGWRKLPLHNWATSSYLSKVPDVKKVEGLKQLAFPHAKHVAARQQERPDVLQAQKLCWEDRKGWSSVWAVWHPAAWVQKRLLFCSDWWDRAANTPEDDSSKGWLNRIYGLHESVCFH